MNIIYNDKTDLLYIRFDDRKQDVVNRRVSEDIVLDIGEKDSIVGIEILDASKHVALDRLLPVTYRGIVKKIMNHLYFGDNLQVLRNSIADNSVDLIYLDPPFNSKRDYNLLFKSPKGHDSDAQIMAFEDSWHWGEQAEREFAEIMHQPNTDVAEMMRALRGFLGENDMMAYLTMMANRLLELHKVLKATGSLYLHCDPTASHYLKVVLDSVFGKENLVNEITGSVQCS